MIYKVKEIPQVSIYTVLQNIFDAPVVGYITVDHIKKTISFNMHKSDEIFCSDKVEFDTVDKANKFMRFYQEELENAGERWACRGDEAKMYSSYDTEGINKAVKGFGFFYNMIKEVV